jgi:hypothetical protein
MTSLACCALGAWLRVDYALFHHHLRHRASSDALLYLERAQELLQRGAVPNLPATIWPPGTSALWAVLSAVDPAQQLTAAWSAAASILVMPLTAAIAGLLAGPRAAWIALAIAALHPGFIHYSGFALAEQPFQLAIAVAMYLTLSALVRLEAEPPAVGVAPPLARATSAAPRAAVSGDAVVGENAAASSSGASTSSAPNVVRASASPSAAPRSDPTPTGHYIQAEVVTPYDARSEGRRGKLGPASPGGGSAQGKWFGRFNLKSEPPTPEPELKAARRGFIGRGGGGGGGGARDEAATSARRSAFADRGRAEVLGRAGASEAAARGDRERAGGSADEPSTKRAGGLPFKTGSSRGAVAGTAAAREAWKGELDPKRPAGDLVDVDADAARARQPADAADEAARKRAGALPLQGGGRADDAAAASREAWKGELDPNRPAGDLLKSEAPAAARDPQALADELAGEPAAAGDGDSQTDAAARSAFRSGPPDDDAAAAEAAVEEGDATRAARLRAAAEGGASDSEGATGAEAGDARTSLRTSDAAQSDAGASRTGAGSTASATGSAFGASFAIGTGPGDGETREGATGPSRPGAGSTASATGSAFGASFATGTGPGDGENTMVDRSGVGSTRTGGGDADSGLGSGSASSAGDHVHSAATSEHTTAGAAGTARSGDASTSSAIGSGYASTASDPQGASGLGTSGAGGAANLSAAAGSGDGSHAHSANLDSTADADLHSPRIAAHALAGTARLWIAGAAVGCSWGLAALIRPNALPVAAVGAFALLVFSRNVVPSRAVWAALGAATAALLVLGAAANRCTATAAGHFCLVSNNVAMNVALGQAGPVYGLEFHDARHPERTTTWIAPSLVQHGYQGMLQVPASVYDSTGIWSWVADRFTQDPLGYAVRAVGNAFDLFNLAYWPDEYGRYSVRAAFVLRQAWTAAVLIPALFALFTLARRAFGRTPTRPVGIFVLGTLLGLLLSAALSLGESRYRIPFDGLLIGLASATYARMTGWHAPGFIPAEQLGARRWALWLPTLTASIALIIAMTHPSLNLGLLLPQRGAALPNRGRQDWATAADFAVPHAAGSAWNGPGTYVWKCSPDCGELQIRLGGRRRARQVHLSVDHNDRYRVLFYRSGELRAFTDIPPALNTPAGLQSTVIDVPKPARTGFDAIGVQPLYGDGGYSIGHLILE